MNVRTLIEKLEQLNPDDEVFAENIYDDKFRYVPALVAYVNNGKNSKQLF